MVLTAESVARTNRRGIAASLAAYLLLAFFWLLPSSKSPRNMIADAGDPLHLAYVLAWDAHQMIRSPAEIFEANSFFPAKGSLSFSEHLIPEAILVAPVFWATGNAILTYNVSVAMGLVLSALAMFALVKELTGSSGAAFLGGLAYSFTGFSLIETARVQVIHMQWWPLALVFLGRFVTTSRFVHALWFTLLLGLQGLSCGYYLLFTGIVLPFWLVALYAVRPARPSWPEVQRLAGAGLIACCLVGIVIQPYTGRVGIDTDPEVSAGVDLREFLTPGRANPILGTGSTASYAREYIGGSTGLLALLGVALGLRSARGTLFRGFVWLALVTLLIGGALAMGVRLRVFGEDIGQGPLGFLLSAIPLGTRHVPRFIALTKVGLGILVGFGVAEGASRLTSHARNAGFLLLAVIIPLEHWQPLDAIYGTSLPADDRIPPVYRALAGLGQGAVVELPLYSKKRLWAQYQYFSTYHWRPTVFGRTRFYPPWLDYLTSQLHDFPDESSLTSLETLGVDTIVVHPLEWPREERNERLAAIESSSRLRLLGTYADPSPLIPSMGESRVYSLITTEPPAPPCRLGGELLSDEWSASTTVGIQPRKAFDNDLDTYWTTGRVQETGDRFRVVFNNTELLGAVSLATGRRSTDFPRHLLIELRGADGEWRRVLPIGGSSETRRTLAGLISDPLKAEYVIRFPPQQSTGIRLSLTWAGSYLAPWTIAELRAFRRCS